MSLCFNSHYHLWTFILCLLLKVCFSWLSLFHLFISFWSFLLLYFSSTLALPQVSQQLLTRSPLLMYLFKTKFPSSNSSWVSPSYVLAFDSSAAFSRRLTFFKSRSGTFTYRASQRFFLEKTTFSELLRGC